MRSADLTPLARDVMKMPASIGLIFFSFVVAPALFRVLDPSHAGDVVAVVFPRYYALGVGAGVIALATGLVLARDAGGGWWRGALVAIAIGLAVTTWAGGVVQPRARRLRAAMQTAGESSPEAAAFRRLHGRAVALNAAALLAALVGLGCSATAVRS